MNTVGSESIILDKGLTINSAIDLRSNHNQQSRALLNHLSSKNMINQDYTTNTNDNTASLAQVADNALKRLQ